LLRSASRRKRPPTASLAPQRTGRRPASASRLEQSALHERAARAADSGVVSATRPTGAVPKPCGWPACAAGPTNATLCARTGGRAAVRGTCVPNLDTLALVYLLTDGSRLPGAGATPALTPGRWRF
jgi:hypothetical protein